MKKILLLIFLLTFVFVPPALAHKVNLFCYIEGDSLCGEGYFSGGRPAQKAEIEVYSGEKVVATAITDEEGRFCITVPAAGALRIVLNAGKAHRGEFLLKNYSGEVIEKKTVVIEEKRQDPVTDKLVNQKLKSLQERVRNLEKKSSQASLVQIIGGIGWIIGIFSLLYLLKRKNAS